MGEGKGGEREWDAGDRKGEGESRSREEGGREVIPGIEDSLISTLNRLSENILQIFSYNQYKIS